MGTIEPGLATRIFGRRWAVAERSPKPAWVQIEDEPVRALGAGEVVWTPPGAKHWHGATRSSGMTHVSVSESEEGSSVTWLEPVNDGQYHGPHNQNGFHNLAH